MRTIEKSLRLVSYLRVSTEQQLDGYGLQVQAEAVASWASKHGHRIVQVCTDEGISGTADAVDREGLSCAISAIEAGESDGLLVARMDRLARALTTQEAILAHIWRHQGRVLTADQGEVLADDPDDPMRTFLRLVVGSAAQLDRSLIVKRLRDGRQAKAAAGGYTAGSPRYGWRAESGELVEDPVEQAVIARMVELKASGLSMNAIATALTAEGAPSKRGGIWRADAVARVLDPAARERARRRVEVARLRAAS
ncbi:MAG: resolvase [Ilumatobacteraceae bacterium]|nr:resolvase [Ilumatobacteraceae bacterium]